MGAIFPSNVLFNVEDIFTNRCYSFRGAGKHENEQMYHSGLVSKSFFFFNTFDPKNVMLDDKNDLFSGWPTYYMDCTATTGTARKRSTSYLLHVHRDRRPTRKGKWKRKTTKQPQ